MSGDERRSPEVRPSQVSFKTVFTVSSAVLIVVGLIYAVSQALVAVAGMVGNRLVAVVSRVVPKRTSVIVLATCIQAVAIVASGLVGSFSPAVACYLVSAIAGGIAEANFGR